MTKLIIFEKKKRSNNMIHLFNDKIARPSPPPNNCLIQLHTYFLRLFQKSVVHTKLNIYIVYYKTVIIIQK